MGATQGGTTTGYLRGEIAQGMFVNVKNVIDSFHPKLPFGIAQSGSVDARAGRRRVRHQHQRAEIP